MSPIHAYHVPIIGHDHAKVGFSFSQNSLNSKYISQINKPILGMRVLVLKKSISHGNSKYSHQISEC